MMDEDFNLSLIEVNTNPCLDQPCPLLARMIPHMLENSLWIAVDPIFPFPDHDGKLFLHLNTSLGSHKKSSMYDLTPENKYELIFDELKDGKLLNKLLTKPEVNFYPVK